MKTVPELLQLTYRSQFNAGRIDKPLATLRDIVRASKANNEREGITGLLLFDGETFIQVLEGSPDSVDRTYQRIAKDARHRSVTTLRRAAAADRLFPQWRMGGYYRDEADAAIFAAHGATSCRLADIPSEQALPLMIELAGRGRSLAL